MSDETRELLRIHSNFVSQDYSDYFEDKLIFDHDTPILKLNTPNNSLMIEMTVDLVYRKIYCLFGSCRTEKSLSKFDLNLDLTSDRELIFLSMKSICRFNGINTYMNISRNNVVCFTHTHLYLDYDDGKFCLYDDLLIETLRGSQVISNLIHKEEYLEDLFKFL